MIACLSNLLNRPCNLFIRFEDRRDAAGKGHVIGPNGRIFNHLGSDTNAGLRMKFIALFFSQALTGIVYRLPYKVYDLLSGEVITRGRSRGQREFQIYRLKQFEQHGKVHRLARECFIVKNVLVNVISEIVKIAAFPLSLVGLQFVSFVGIFCPLSGRVFTCIIEETFHTEMDIQERLNHGTLKHCYFRTLLKMCCPTATFFLFAAPCMQSLQTWQKEKLKCVFFYRDAYYNTPAYSIVYRANYILENKMEIWSSYFSPQVKEQVVQLIQNLRAKLPIAYRETKKPQEEIAEYHSEDIRRPKNNIKVFDQAIGTGLKLVNNIIALKDQAILGEIDKSHYEIAVAQLVRELDTANINLSCFKPSS